MAIVAALLLALVLGSLLAGASLVAALERQAAAAHSASAALRQMAEGGVALAAAELTRREWAPLLAGAGSDQWRGPVSAAARVAELTALVQRETMMTGAHGADTPSWRLFVEAPWREVAGHETRGELVVWLADDWEERDSDPGHDSNGLVLVRAAAIDGPAVAWCEALCRRDSDGQVRPGQVRVW